MPATYRFIADYDYWLTGRKRQQRSRAFVFRPLIAPLISISLMLAAWLWLEIYHPENAADLAPTMFGFVLFFASALLLNRIALHWRVKKALAKVTTETTCTLSEDGISVVDRLVQSKAAWSVYPRAVRSSDGVLLARGHFVWLWLPDSALQGATPKEVTDLVQSKTQLRHVA